jgi:hypothetical protein
MGSNTAPTLIPMELSPSSWRQLELFGHLSNSMTRFMPYWWYTLCGHKQSERGIVVFAVQVINQHDVVVQDGEMTMMMKRAPQLMD